jgi:hypothetical protein
VLKSPAVEMERRLRRGDPGGTPSFSSIWRICRALIGGRPAAEQAKRERSRIESRIDALRGKLRTVSPGYERRSRAPFGLHRARPPLRPRLGVRRCRCRRRRSGAMCRSCQGKMSAKRAACGRKSEHRPVNRHLVHARQVRNATDRGAPAARERGAAGHTESGEHERFGGIGRRSWRPFAPVPGEPQAPSDGSPYTMSGFMMLAQAMSGEHAGAHGREVGGRTYATGAPFIGSTRA